MSEKPSNNVIIPITDEELTEYEDKLFGAPTLPLLQGELVLRIINTLRSERLLYKKAQKERNEAVADRKCLAEKLAVYGCPEELVIGYECDTPEGAMHCNKDCWLKYAAVQRGVVG
jgi:hypothetical protein